jgi:hypothetical protein
MRFDAVLSPLSRAAYWPERGWEFPRRKSIEGGGEWLGVESE